jgi:hypothetical protein
MDRTGAPFCFRHRGMDKIAKVSDQQAESWLTANATLWASVVSPFILVQEEKHAVH